MITFSHLHKNELKTWSLLHRGRGLHSQEQDRELNWVLPGQFGLWRHTHLQFWSRVCTELHLILGLQRRGLGILL